MNSTIRIDLHCHSTVSDGALAPQEIAARVADKDVRYAALTDHNNVDGIRAFREVLSLRGVGVIDAVEMTTLCDSTEVHIVAYGIDTTHPQLLDLLQTIRNTYDPNPSQYALPRRITTSEAIAIIHLAGGLAVMAHPLISVPDFTQLSRLLHTLRNQKLDGIELFRNEPTTPDRDKLADLARKLDFVCSAGSDYHFTQRDKDTEPGIDIPSHHWQHFRSTLLAANAAYRTDSTPATLPIPVESGGKKFQWRAFAFHIVLPSMLALALFAIALFSIVLPAFENSLVERKREMIRELTAAAWSILNSAHRDVISGERSLPQAQLEALKEISVIRYGKEQRSYFWIQDTLPTMLMHPYRTDLNGRDLSGFVDQHGDTIFVLFSRLAKYHGDGYVRYVWQWADDPSRLELKESYIRLFEPWGWIIGTGLYVNDVKQELHRLDIRIRIISGAIFLFILATLLYVMRHSLRIERTRTAAVELLRESIQRYKTFTEAATEGVLFISGVKCRYANPLALEMLGYTHHDLELIDIYDIIPSLRENTEPSDIAAVLTSRYLNNPQQVMLRGNNQTLPGCTLTVRTPGDQESDGLLLIIRRSQAYATQALTTPGAPRLASMPFSVFSHLREQLSNTSDTETIAAVCGQIPDAVSSLLELGTFGPKIAQGISTIADTVTTILIEQSIEELGPAPVPFAFLALGSHGRQEQTLFTDQDNALIYDTTGGNAATQAYFAALTQRVCSGLARAGYHECGGKTMASEPHWCQSLENWNSTLGQWIAHPDAHSIMEFVVFSDARSVYGEHTLLHQLQRDIAAQIAHTPGFLPLLAQNALEFKAPVRFFGLVVNPGGGGTQPGTLDLKPAGMAMVHYARIYSLQQGSFVANTAARLESLLARGVILESKFQEVQTAYELMLRLRLRHQVQRHKQGQPLDNAIAVSSLGHIQEAILRECFGEIDLLQSQIKRDFLGGD